MTSRRAQRSQLDWVAIQSAWTKSDETVRQIGERHGVSHARISQKAKSEGWGERRGGSGVPPRPGSGKLPTNGKLPDRGKLPSAGKAPAGKKPAEGKVLAVVREWQKNRQELGRVTIEEYNGRILIRGWSWYRDLNTGELKPTRKGWALSVDQVRTQLIPGLNDALVKATELGLLENGEGE